MPSGYVATTTTSGEDEAPEQFADELGTESNNHNTKAGLMQSVRVRMLARHDSLFSVTSQYEDPSDNDLNAWQGAALLTADCMGTGLLALPEDIKVLGVRSSLLLYEFSSGYVNVG